MKNERGVEFPLLQAHGSGKEKGPGTINILSQPTNGRRESPFPEGRAMRALIWEPSKREGG